MISIIIPCYNEIKNIDRLQKALDALEGEREILFTDGGSTDGSFERIRYPKIQKAKGRGAQMDLAVEQTKGDVLWFLHGDTFPEKTALRSIEESRAEWGCFKLRFRSKKAMMRIVAFNSDNRVRFRHIAFGDQGIFIRRALYDDIGGFRHIPLMEDYDLSIRLKEKGYKPALLKNTLFTDARRFEENGIWHTIFHMQRLQRAFRKGVDPAILAKEY
ncbi:TIGR04283 family arsenosugar biosynthesis glycosyltransferase [Aedoeadaptatus coxii]|uniref:4,4'-diaponeurosporenoate glycosyltransferase n=1 Tax=Aedoeadaptatus coxii TaxID=755172 RepID=A0A134ACX9_9FIRM|nr:TIGR04283 family arsenosugar biosynthesis glycosyltransferase [Peptoniphilus coxii]KXB65567.1 glycosyltransferase, group 2 family protein [Peptoniphilus coxii]